VNSPKPDPEFLELLSGYASGNLHSEAAARLQEHLAGCAEKRRLFRRYLQVDTALRESTCGALRLASPTPEEAREPWYWKAAAAVATLGCILSLWVSRSPAPADPAPPTVAVLTQSVGVAWKPGSRPLFAGNPLPAGKIAFDRGLIQLEFINGAVVVAEGPAEIELLSPERAVCRYGKVRASVPPQAHGFTVTAPDMDVVDLGTEFGLAVGKDGKSQVHVLEGEVRMHPKNASAKSLFAGQGLEWMSGMPPIPIPSNGQTFTGRAELLSLSTGRHREILEQWHRESERIRHLPETVFHYNFEPEELWSRTLQNLRPGGDPGLNGAVVGCQWSEGRWPGKRALDFKGPSDRVRIHIPGNYREATLAAWVRVESWGNRWLSSLLLTDAFQKGAIHWQLSDKGEIILGLHHGRMENHFSAPVIGPNDLGRWMYLVTTYDEKSLIVSHYLDGELVGSTPVKNPAPLAPGMAELGNWSMNHAKDLRARSLIGRMDEFTFYARALTAEEVRLSFEKGAPRS
jgi:hypothetical protein